MWLDQSEIAEQRPIEVVSVIRLLAMIVAIAEGKAAATRFRVANSLRDAADMIERK
jgi:hypothetical protein